MRLEAGSCDKTEQTVFRITSNPSRRSRACFRLSLRSVPRYYNVRRAADGISFGISGARETMQLCEKFIYF